MPSPVETVIRGAVTKGVVALGEFNRGRRKSKGPNAFMEGVRTPTASKIP